MSKDWYDGHHKGKETAGFSVWWLEFYGHPGDYLLTEGEQDEYWVRKGFALIGWLAAKA